MVRGWQNNLHPQYRSGSLRIRQYRQRQGWNNGRFFCREDGKTGSGHRSYRKIWVPIGEGVRKQVEEVQFADIKTKITRFSGVTDEADLIARLNSHVPDENKDFDGCVYLGNYYFAQKVDGGWKYFYSDNDVVTGNFFAGTFDGQGHKIIGLSDIGYTPFNPIIYANSSRVIKAYTFGLFGIVSGDVTVKNLNFENIQIVGAYYDADEK